MHTFINIFYHVFTKEIDQIPLLDLCVNLPDEIITKALRYKSNISALQFLIGRHLLRVGLKKTQSKDTLDALYFSERSKPILPNTIFNISHSKHIVVCALSSHGKVGVDIEVPQDTNLEDLQKFFTETEWQLVGNDHTAIYQLWCRKEAILKAADITLPQLNKQCSDATVKQLDIDDTNWHIHRLKFLTGLNAYGSICTEYPIQELKTQACFKNIF